MAKWKGKAGRNNAACKAYAQEQRREKNKFARLMKHILKHALHIRMHAVRQRLTFTEGLHMQQSRLKDALAALRKLVAVLPGTVTKQPLHYLNDCYSIKV
jgi:translation initiation factor 1 (eIF-1/SUI1)